MNDEDPVRQTEHEGRVADAEEAARTRDPLGREPGLEADEDGGTPDAASSESELAAERRGTTADEVDEEIAEDERTPLDSAYQPRTG